MPRELEIARCLAYSAGNMQFLKTLAWVMVAVLAAIVAGNNWRDVTLDLWSNLQIDIKVPILLLAVFLLGAVPTWLVMRGKIWRSQRRLAVDVPSIPAARSSPDPEDVV